MGYIKKIKKIIKKADPINVVKEVTSQAKDAGSAVSELAKDAASSVGGAVKDVAGSTLTDLYNQFIAAGESVTEAAKRAMDIVGQNARAAREAARDAVTTLKQAVQDANIPKAAKDISNSVKEVIQPVTQPITESAKDILNSIGGAAEDVIRPVTRAADAVLPNEVTGPVKDAVETLREAVQDAARPVENFAENPVDTLQNLYTDTTDTLQNNSFTKPIGQLLENLSADQLLNRINNFAQNPVDTLKNLTADTTETLREAVQDAARPAAEFITDPVNTAEDIVHDIPYAPEANQLITDPVNTTEDIVHDIPYAPEANQLITDPVNTVEDIAHDIPYAPELNQFITDPVNTVEDMAGDVVNTAEETAGDIGNNAITQPVVDTAEFITDPVNTIENVIEDASNSTKEALHDTTNAISEQAKDIGDSTGEAVKDINLGDLTGQTAATQAAREYNAMLERIYSRENRYSPEQLAAQKQLFPIQQGMLYSSLGMPMPQGSSPEGQALWQAMQRANAQQRGQEQSALSTGYQNANRSLMNQNRQLFGGGSSGHVAGRLGDLQTQYMQQRPQVVANYNNRQVANQQGALSGLTSMAYGTPLGNQPYNPAQSPTNTMLPDLIGALAAPTIAKAGGGIANLLGGAFSGLMSLF